MLPATRVVYRIATTRHRPDGTQIGEAVRSELEAVWRGHWQPMICYRVRVNGRRLRIVGAELTEAGWVLDATEAVVEEDVRG